MDTKRRWNYELIAALSAVAVSAFALIISAVQTQVMLKQQDASVWPVVHWSASINVNAVDSTGDFEIYVQNKGVGPAVIEQVRLTYQEKSYPEDSLTKIIFHKLLKVKELSAKVNLVTTQGNILTPNERSNMLNVHIDNKGNVFAQQFMESILKEELDIYICYKNIYGKTWVVHQNNKVKEVIKCP